MDHATKDHMLEVNGINLHVIESGEGPLLLFLHGFPSYGGSWKGYLDRLDDHFHVVAPDLRGYNLSSQPEEVDDYRMETLMRDVIELIERLGASQVCLVGHDWGGLLAWYLAAHYPDVFSKLVIINAPHPKAYQNLMGKDLEQTTKALYLPLLVAPGSEHLLAANNYKYLQTNLFSKTDYEFSASEKEEILNAWQHGLKGPVNYYRSYIAEQKQLAGNMPQVKVPTLVLWGEQDQSLSNKNLDGLNEYVEQLEIKRYGSGTHWITYEMVDELSDEIRRFCAPPAALEALH